MTATCQACLTTSEQASTCPQCGESSWASGVAPFTAESCSDLDLVTDPPDTPPPPADEDAPLPHISTHASAADIPITYTFPPEPTTAVEAPKSKRALKREAKIVAAKALGLPPPAEETEE